MLLTLLSKVPKNHAVIKGGSVEKTLMYNFQQLQFSFPVPLRLPF